MNKHFLMRIFAIITSIGAYTMVILGVVVTNTGSGQGCGNSWPFCHGQLIPNSMPMSTVYEYSHRISSGIDGALILGLTVLCWLLYRKDTRIKVLSVMSLFFVVLQGALGAVTVAYEGTWTKYPLLAFHFGFSLISFASVILLTVRLFQINRVRRAVLPEVGAAPRGLQYAVWGLAAYTYIVVYTGALVEHTGAVFGCGRQFPGCTSYIPTFSSTAGIQMIHRYAAAIIWFLALAFLLAVIRLCRERRNIIAVSWWAFIFISLQAVSGVLNVLNGGTVGWNLLHTTIIAIFFVLLSYLCMQFGWPGKRYAQKPLPAENTTENNVALGARG